MTTPPTAPDDGHAISAVVASGKPGAWRRVILLHTGVWVALLAGGLATVAIRDPLAGDPSIIGILLGWAIVVAVVIGAAALLVMALRVAFALEPWVDLTPFEIREVRRGRVLRRIAQAAVTSIAIIPGALPPGAPAGYRPRVRNARAHIASVEGFVLAIDQGPADWDAVLGVLRAWARADPGIVRDDVTAAVLGVRSRPDELH